MSHAEGGRDLVVDASVIVDFLLRTREAPALPAAMEDPDTHLHVPALCDVEVAAATRRALLRGHVETEGAESIADELIHFPAERHDHGALVLRVLELRNNFTAYDACYVALAEALGASLLTADTRFAASARAHTAVEVQLAAHR